MTTKTKAAQKFTAKGRITVCFAGKPMYYALKNPFTKKIDLFPYRVKRGFGAKGLPMNARTVPSLIKQLNAQLKYV